MHPYGGGGGEIGRYYKLFKVCSQSISISLFSASVLAGIPVVLVTFILSMVFILIVLYVYDRHTFLEKWNIKYHGIAFIHVLDCTV